MMTCPVCGGALRERQDGCTRCPVGAGCGMICCENCGYQTVAPRSATVDLVRRLWVRWFAPRDPGRTGRA